jgi:F-type H+-transporting ATPase subunit epsilon
LAATFNFRVLTPNRRAIDDTVISIVAPGEDGYLGVLANHAPLITTLRSGDLKVRYEGDREVHYSIGPGILKVEKNVAILLTESIETASETA